jgi:hypothetical protein
MDVQNATQNFCLPKEKEYDVELNFKIFYDRAEPRFPFISKFLGIINRAKKTQLTRHGVIHSRKTEEGDINQGEKGDPQEVNEDGLQRFTSSSVALRTVLVVLALLRVVRLSRVARISRVYMSRGRVPRDFRVSRNGAQGGQTFTLGAEFADTGAR